MINQEEYKILKGLDDRYKWIARDSEHSKDYSGEVLAYAEKPDKCNGIIWSDTWGYEHLPKHLFQFIQWPDEEPHNIQELIDEYESDKKRRNAISTQLEESEETEVKNIEWLKLKLNTEIYRLQKSVVERKETTDESAYNDGRYRAVESVLRLIDQLDDPEITEEQAWEVINGEYGEETLQNNIDYLESNGYVVTKKTVIPQFVADWINKYKEYGYGLYQALKTMENNARSWRRIYDWYRENTLEFVMAYLTRDYEIEEEPKYYVLDEGNVPLLAIDNREVNRSRTHLTIYKDGRDNTQFALTEQEIKDYDERYFAFAKPVEEVHRD